MIPKQTGEWRTEHGGHPGIADQHPWARRHPGYHPQVANAVRDSGLEAGIVTVFCPGSTGGLSTIEYESGALADLQQVLDEIAPPDRDYRHHQTGEDNGYAHLWNLTIGHQQIVPITKGELDLGPWEQVYYAEFDGMRKKRVIVKVMGI